MPALNAEPLADSSRGRAASDAPSTKYALLAGRYSAAPADTSSSAPTARAGLPSPGTKAANPAVRSANASSIARRNPIRPATGPATTPPANWISEATASTKPTVPSPSPRRRCSSTDMYGSTAKLPSVIRNDAASSARWAPLSGVRGASPRPFLHRRAGPAPASGAPFGLGWGSSVRPHTASATTGRTRTAALHARCCASSAVAPSASTIPVQPR